MLLALVYLLMRRLVILATGSSYGRHNDIEVLARNFSTSDEPYPSWTIAFIGSTLQCPNFIEGGETGEAGEDSTIPLRFLLGAPN